MERVFEKGSWEGGKRYHYKPKSKEQLGRGQATPIQTKTNKTPRAPPQVPSPCCIGILTQLNSCGALNLRGRARGLVGFGLYWYRLPPFPTALVGFGLYWYRLPLPNCSFDFGLCWWRLPPFKLSF